jgi:hypothetical protein
MLPPGEILRTLRAACSTAGYQDGKTKRKRYEANGEGELCVYFCRIARCQVCLGIVTEMNV